MDTSRKRLAVPSREYAPLVARQRIKMQSEGRALQRGDDTTARVSQVWHIGVGGRHWLLRSIRRPISMLNNSRELACGERIHDRPNGRPGHTWRLPHGEATP